MTDRKETGFSEQHEAHRYSQIHEVVDQMGGWANFMCWINRHSKEYFETCSNLEKELATTEAQLKSTLSERDTLKAKLEIAVEDLISISKNSCCDQCQEAKAVALSSLAKIEATGKETK